MKYCLIQDEDCHWYICPLEYVEDAYVSFSYEEIPDYVQPVGGHPRRVIFENPEIK